MSNGDKRSVSTDALETLGTIIDDRAGRDAIHIAVEPVIAAQTLRPGEDVGRTEDGRFGLTGSPVGIVDPFLKSTVKAGQRFWLLVYPRQITSLRHVWSHPAFPDSTHDPKSASEAWLRNWVDANDCPPYEEIIEALLTGKGGKNEDYGVSYGVSYGNAYLCALGTSPCASIPDEFWDHAEIVTGRNFAKEQRTEYFSCSC